MPRRQKYSLEDFPKAGTVFAMSLDDGRTGVCRVLRVAVSGGAPAALVSASDWIGDKPLALDHPAVRRFLVLNHHFHTGQPELIWVWEPPPQQFKKIGEIPVLPADEQAESFAYSGWESLPYQVLAQWRWDHERAAVLKEDAAKKKLEQASQEELSSKRAANLSKITFPRLLRKNLFPRWKDYPPKRAKVAAEKILTSFILDLQKAKRPLDRKMVKQKLKLCVEKLNSLDTRIPFIETIEREDLFDLFEEILSAAKLPELLDEVDKWRDW
jgi:hypothetical protein